MMSSAHGFSYLIPDQINQWCVNSFLHCQFLHSTTLNILNITLFIFYAEYFLIAWMSWSWSKLSMSNLKLFKSVSWRCSKLSMSILNVFRPVVIEMELLLKIGVSTWPRAYLCNLIVCTNDAVGICFSLYLRLLPLCCEYIYAYNGCIVANVIVSQFNIIYCISLWFFFDV